MTSFRLECGACARTSDPTPLATLPSNVETSARSGQGTGRQKRKFLLILRNAVELIEVFLVHRPALGAGTSPRDVPDPGRAASS